MKTVEIKPDIFWVGAVDWAVRDFHSYHIANGTTYNNYLILDKHITLLDAVKVDFVDKTISNIKSLCDPSKIENLIVNHIEPDHSSGLSRIVEIAPNATIYITEKGKKGLDRYFDTSGWKFKIVKTGDTLNTGKYNLLFLETPMLHWPDSMMTYVKEAKLLVSQDAFGQHMAAPVRFDDEFEKFYSYEVLEEAVVDYYANILMPFGNLIKLKINEIQKLGLEIDMIAPDHGLIWRKYPEKVIKKYLDLAEGKAALKIVVVYDTMWRSTEQMLSPIVDGIIDEGVACKIIKLRATPLSNAITEFWESRGCLIGTPTVNNTIFPSVAEFTTHLRGLRPRNRIAAAFGSYGWAGGAVKEAYEEFKKMGVDTFEPGLQLVYKPSAEDAKLCYDFGREFARKAKEYHKKFE